MKNIVFSGGGFKAWAYIGVLRTLKELKITDLNEVLGVSAGGVFGLFYILGIQWDFLLDFFMNMNFKEVYDIDIDNIMIQQSLFAGTKFTEILKELISYKIDPNITFAQFRKFSKIKFTTNALNITTSKCDYFNYELTPDVKVVDAIRASCNLPFIFPPYLINGSYYYDGGMYDNCPVHIFDEVETIAFDLFSKEIDTTNNSSFKILDLLRCMVNIISDKTETQNENIYHILGKEFNKECYNLNQSRDDIFNIYMHGYINSKDILFKNHIALALN